MRGILLAALIVASNVLIGSIAGNAEAAALDPSLVMQAGGYAAVVQPVTNVCGSNGCVRVQTQRIKHQKPGSVAGNHI